MKRLTFIFVFLLGATLNFAQVNAKLLQYPDVSATKITFVYAGDIWVAPKEGGLAVKLSSPKGIEIMPKFSPDGKYIAFSGNYDGNIDVFVIPTEGGTPERITNHPGVDRILDWSPKGDFLLFASSRESGRQRFNQIFKISVKGGQATKLPVPYGEFAELSPDGNWLAYTPRTRLFRTWKRYRGGMATDIWLFNLKDFSSKNITDEAANDELPMWKGKFIYFLSDRDKNERFNIWKYNTKNGNLKELTFFKDYDVHFPSIGPEDIVFEAGGKLYLLNLKTEKYKEVKIKVVTDNITLLPVKKKVARYLQNASVSPHGNRVVVEARGELFSLPAKEGAVYNLTNSSGVAERFPAFSPDGKKIAFWSDKTGEYELTVIDTKNPYKQKTLTDTKSKFKYHLYWSPNSKMIAFVDNSMRIRIYDFSKDEIIDVDKGLYMYEGNLESFKVSWSKDSRWLAYSRGVENQHNAIFIYDVENGKVHQVTSGFYSDSQPAFDPNGKYLYYLTNRTFRPVYSSVDNTFIYPNSTNIAIVTLTKDIVSPFIAKNDTVKVKTEVKSDKKKSKKKDKKKNKPVKIDFNGFEARAELLQLSPGNFGKLSATENKPVYSRYPNAGVLDGESKICYYDLEKKKEKTIVTGSGRFQISADGKKMLVFRGSSLYIVDIKPKQKLKDKIKTGEMKAVIYPRKEWKQIFYDAWRMERDFFYDPNMHGVDWNEIKVRYGKMLKDVVTRWDLNYLIGEMIGEISSSHTYRGGGDEESAEHVSCGMLGIDWGVDNGFFKIKKIIKGAKWDVIGRSPLDKPGIDVKEGDYILAVNGVPLDVNKEPYVAFEGLTNKTVELTVNSKPTFEGAKKIFVKTFNLNSELALRHRAWVEANRKFVAELSDNQLGYIYVPNTGTEGQNELFRQFLAQIDKKGLIIDERFNSGGQIPDRFVELLNRKPLAFWAVRDGKNWQWPPYANFGPKVMLINGWSGSGGDAFPDFFRKEKLGKLIGLRTWGGLIGISGVPSLIDNGYLTVPTFRMYNPDGTWFKEGHGVDPDIRVVEDPTQLAKGIDVQLKRGVEEVLKELKTFPNPYPKQPPYEKR